MRQDSLHYTLYSERIFFQVTCEIPMFIKHGAFILYINNKAPIFRNGAVIWYWRNHFVTVITKCDRWDVWVDYSKFSSKKSHYFGSILCYNRSILFSNSSTLLNRFLTEMYPLIWLLSVSSALTVEFNEAHCGCRGDSELETKHVSRSSIKPFLLYKKELSLLYKRWGCHFLEAEWVIWHCKDFTTEKPPNLTVECIQCT